MTRHISRHKDKSIDPTGILEARANEEAPEIENVGDGRSSIELDSYLETLEVSGMVNSLELELLSIARRLLADNLRLREGIEDLTDISHGNAGDAVVVDVDCLRALIGDE